MLLLAISLNSRTTFKKIIVVPDAGLESAGNLNLRGFRTHLPHLRYTRGEVYHPKIENKDIVMTNNSTITVVQCWDDGVTTDIRLIEILRQYGAKATFNLNAGLHEKQRKLSWIYKGAEVVRLGWDEMREVYEDFMIANHSLTHPHLEQMPIKTARRDIVEGRHRLQQFFGQPVLGFVYPFGSYSETVMQLVQEAGHVYARTASNVDQPFPPVNTMMFHPSCHFLAPDLWLRYRKTKKSGVFYFWGHSYEITTEKMWHMVEKMTARISADPGSCWADVADLFNNGAC